MYLMIAYFLGITTLTPVFVVDVPEENEVMELARIIDGESRNNLDAAYYVGWVAKNRLQSGDFGDSYIEVASGFYGYNPESQPHIKVIDVARKVIRSTHDPTDGCLFALFREDIKKLRIKTPADVIKDNWFFFKVWPIKPQR